MEPLRVMRSEIGEGCKYKNRSSVFELMSKGDDILFEAETSVEYASVRGAAYRYAVRRDMKLKAHRINPAWIRIRHLGDRG